MKKTSDRVSFKSSRLLPSKLRQRLLTVKRAKKIRCRLMRLPSRHSMWSYVLMPLAFGSEKLRKLSCLATDLPQMRRSSNSLSQTWGRFKLAKSAVSNSSLFQAQLRQISGEILKTCPTGSKQKPRRLLFTENPTPSHNTSSKLSTTKFCQSCSRSSFDRNSKWTRRMNFTNRSGKDLPRFLMNFWPVVSCMTSSPM